MSGNADVGDLGNSLPSWIFDHLGSKSYMSAKVTQLPSSHKEDPLSPKGSPSVDIRPPLERETNTMTQGELDHLRESYSFLDGIQIRLHEVGETIMSACSDEVGFYEAIF